MDWNSCPYVHLMEVDYIPGIVHGDPAVRGELWGGMSLAIFSPEPRQGKLEVQARNSLGFDRSR